MKPYLLLLFLSVATALATDRTTTGQPADILAKIDLSDPNGGDTITMPSGNVTWTGTLTIPAGKPPFTLRGHADGTSRVTFNAASGPAILWNVAGNTSWTSNKLSRLTGIYFAKGTGPSVIEVRGHAGNNNVNPNYHSRFRWDNCTLEVSGENWMRNWTGVIDHNTFIKKADNGPIFRPSHVEWNGGQFGHLSWSAPINWNSDEWIYFEDNKLYSDGSNGSVNSNRGITDATSSARIILRHNQWWGSTGMLTHGNDTGNDPQGSRGVVAYGKFANDMFNVGNNTMSDLRSGVEIVYGNRRHTPNSNANPSGGFGLKTYRQYNWFSTGGSDGNPLNRGGALDNEDTDGTSPNFTVHSYWSGKVTAGGGSVITVANSDNSNPNFTSNQWTPRDGSGYRTATYFIINKTQEAGSVNGWPQDPPTSNGNYGFWSGVIDSHTGNTIDFQAGSFQARLPLSFATGNLVEIRKINTLMDAAGVHGGAPMTGNINNGTLVRPFPRGKNDQVIYPSYYWDNYIWNDGGNNIGVRIDGGNALLNSIREGPNSASQVTPPSAQFHFFNLSGSSTNRNSGHWTGTTPPPSYFTEYAYPHPLITGASPTPTPTGTPPATPTATATFTPTPTSTATSTATATATATATFTPTPTIPPPTPTATPSSTPSATATFTPTATATATSTATATFTPTPTPSATYTPTPTPTPSRLLDVIPDAVGFGPIQQYAVVGRQVQLVNNGNTPLTISNIVADAGVSVDFTTATIQPGTYSTLTVTANTQDLGSLSGAVIITSDKTAGDSGFTFSGEVVSRRIYFPVFKLP